MKIQLISHASVIVDSGDVCIWTDPWIVGEAFNDSWALFPEAVFSSEMLKSIDYIWISHEHPDHFHIPSLRSLPKEFKERVVVIFQQNNSKKMFDAFSKLGYRNHKKLPHRTTVRLSGSTSVYCYQEGQMNSALAIMNEKVTVLNVNDAEIRTPDCKIIRKDIGKIDYVLNQFSIAGYNGNPGFDAQLRKQAASILMTVANNHLDLGAKYTIPFASFVYFCTQDNRYINKYANTVHTFAEVMTAQGLQFCILYMGDILDTEKSFDSAYAMERFALAYKNVDQLSYDELKSTSILDIEQAYRDLYGHLIEKYPQIYLKLLKPVTVYLLDLDLSVTFSASELLWRIKKGQKSGADLVLNSQPFYFALKYPYGTQTLGVSGRVVVQKNAGNWRRYRILFAMNNAEFYLKSGFLFTHKNFEFISMRFRGGMSQIARRLSTMIE